MSGVQRREYSGNAAKTTLSSDISSSDTSILVDDGTGFPTGTDPFFIAIGRGTSSEEKILCSSRTGDTITASSRGADDTSATSHDAGEVVEHVWTAQDADDVNKVAAALTTKGDMLIFGSEPTRLPVGADDTILVADSADAEGAAWKAAAAVADILEGSIDAANLDGLGDFLASVEVDGATEVASVNLTTSYAAVATVSITIPPPWGSWKCFVSATWIGNSTGAADRYSAQITIDGTAQQEQSGLGTGGDDPDIPGAVVARRTGMTTTGSRDIVLQAKEDSGGILQLRDIALYARAVRTS